MCRPTSRSFRTLIKTRAALAKHIKDLKDLRTLRVRAGYRHSGPTDLRIVFFIVARGPVPRERWSARAMARGTLSDARVASEGPRPTMKEAFCRLLHRDQEVSPTGTSLASKPGGLSYRGNGSQNRKRNVPFSTYPLRFNLPTRLAYFSPRWKTQKPTGISTIPIISSNNRLLA